MQITKEYLRTRSVNGRKKLTIPRVNTIAASLFRVTLMEGAGS